MKLGALLVAFALLAAACGSRLPGDTLKALDARSTAAPGASPSAAVSNDASAPAAEAGPVDSGASANDNTATAAATKSTAGQ